MTCSCCAATAAAADYTPARIAAAEARFKATSPEQMDKLEKVLIDWLPARDFAYDRAGFRKMCEAYKDITPPTCVRT